MKILQNKSTRLISLAEKHRSIFIELVNIPELNCRINMPPLFTDRDFDAYLKKFREMANFYVWMIEHDKNICGVVNSSDPRNIKLYQGGYWIHPTFWGHGIASTALSMVKAFLLTECNAERIQAVVEPDNVASMRVLEKCGYTKEGLLRKFYPSLSLGLIDVLMYSCVKTTRAI